MNKKIKRYYGETKSCCSTKNKPGNQPILEELPDDVYDSELLLSKTAGTVEELSKINLGRVLSKEDIDPAKKVWPREHDRMPDVNRVFYPQVAADRIEKAKIDWKSRCRTVHFSVMQTVYLIECKQQQTHKRQMRSRGDLWRRYGALQVIHKIGGWVSTPGQRKNRQFKHVKAGTPLKQAAPKMKPILTIEDFFSRPIPVVQQSTLSSTAEVIENTSVSDKEVGDCNSSKENSKCESDSHTVNKSKL